MKIKADVKSIENFTDYFFIVPDYQREYVWKPDDQVEQFLNDIDNEFDSTSKKQSSYFLGSIIIVKNKGKYDVIDGQQRLTTIVLALCALRDLLELQDLDKSQVGILESIKLILSKFHIKTRKVQVRLELQYDESKDYLSKLIEGVAYEDEVTTSVEKMQQALESIKQRYATHSKSGLDSLLDFVTYFMTEIELVIIVTENLSSALKIFETINQRGAGLNAMDLVKNLLFSEAKEVDFIKIKEKWKIISANLKSCNEEENPLRFLRYFLMARYHDGILREDDIYKWIISKAGVKITNYKKQPLNFADELVKFSKKYSDLVNSTEHMKEGAFYPSVSKIGFINKYKSRQHLIMLLALHSSAKKESIEYLAQQLESFFFFSNTLQLQARNNERLFAEWAAKLRNIKTKVEIAKVVDKTIVPYLTKQGVGNFKSAFLNLNHKIYNPLYRSRYILGMLNDTVSKKCKLPVNGINYYNSFQVEHILPQTPKDEILTEEFTDIEDYNNNLYLFGNVTLVESVINQAVAKFNDLKGDWFLKKQKEYTKSTIISTALLHHDYGIGKNTVINKYKEKSKYKYKTWDKAAIRARQNILLDLAFDTWKINGKRLDKIDE